MPRKLIYFFLMTISIFPLATPVFSATPPPPTITSFSPKSGGTGTMVSITEQILQALLKMIQENQKILESLSMCNLAAQMQCHLQFILPQRLLQKLGMVLQAE